MITTGICQYRAQAGMELECLRAIELLKEAIKRGVSPESEALILAVIEIL